MRTKPEHQPERGPMETEQGLSVSERHFRDIVESAIDVVYTTNPMGYCTYVNPPAERLTGFTREEMLGMHFTQLIPIGWHDKVTEFYRLQLKNRTPETLMEFPIVTRDGEERWVEQTVRLMQVGDRVETFHGIVRDITRRKEIEEALKKSETQFRAIFDHAGIAMMVLDLEGRVVRSNHTLCEFLGYQEAELYGRAFKDLTHPEDVPESVRTFEEFKAGRRGRFQIDQSA